MNQTTHPAAHAIAEWWAGHAFAGTIGDTGDRSHGAGFTMALAVVAGAQGQVPEPSKRDQFVDALARRVTAALERHADRPEWSVTIGVDYGPDPMLADAAEEADVPRGSFPWKTMTWTYQTHVVASLGYHGRNALVWMADDWERPICGEGKYGPGPTYTRLPWSCSGPRYHDDDHTFDTPTPLCGELVARFGANEVCNRPERHSYHVEEDGYTSPMHHDFKAGARVMEQS